MSLDNHKLEVAYAILVTIAWLWAGSQWWYAITNPTGWRWSVVFWITAKAWFLTNAGIIWWFNWTNPTMFEWSVYLLVVAHLEMFIHWLRLDDKKDAFRGVPMRDPTDAGLP